MGEAREVEDQEDTALAAGVGVANEQSEEQWPMVCCSYSPSELLSTATS